MGFIRYIILPLAAPYMITVWARNKLYDIGRFRSSRFDIPVIGIGNLSTGGTGKSPMVEYVTQLICKTTKTAIISRGYRRQTNGYFEVKKDTHVIESGDEPLQFKRKFGDDVIVAVDEKRVHGITSLLFHHPETDAIILDDVYQHRAIKPGLMIMLTTFASPFYKDKVIPLGNLRERRRGYQRADIIVVTKCPPSTDEKKMEEIRRQIEPKPHQEVFFSTIDYGDIKQVYTQEQPSSLPKRLVLVTGIANPDPMLNYLKEKEIEVNHMKYPDHYRYRESDIKKIVAEFDNLATTDKAILTTEKDAMRLLEAKGSSLIESLPIYYQEIKTSFVKDGERFDQKILDYVAENKGNHRVPEE